MAWTPDAIAVAKTEFVGRRIFERQGLKGAQDQQRPDNTYEIYHFEETRDRELSLDRLGKHSVDGKVKNYLNPRSHYAATLFHKKEFLGWAVAQAKTIQSAPNSYEISPSPIAAQDGGPETDKGEPLTENKFHAHLAIPDRLTPYEMAVILAHIFEKPYRFEPAAPPGSVQKSEGWFSAATRCLRSLWG